MVRLQDGVSHYLRVHLIRLLRPSADRFRYREATCFPNASDVWIRLAAVARSVRADRRDGDLVLDVGSSITSFSSLLPPGRVRVVQTDLRFRGLQVELGRTKDRVIADAAHLPFRSSAFSVVASVDMLEHVPAASRDAVLAELKRVSAGRVIIHCPAVSVDGRFVAREDDRAMDAWLRGTYGHGDVNLDEHLACGQPSTEELAVAFPAATIQGTQDSALWTETVRASRVPLLGLVASFRFLRRIARGPQGGPYHSCLMEWTKP